MALSIHPSGKVAFALGKAVPEDADIVEEVFVKHFGGKWIPKEEFAAQLQVDTNRVTYGAMGQPAAAALAGVGPSGPFFR